jgi:hypothetical protein
LCRGDAGRNMGGQDRAPTAILLPNQASIWRARTWHVQGRDDPLAFIADDVSRVREPLKIIFARQGYRKIGAGA